MEKSGRSSGGVEIVGCGGNVRNCRKCAWRATKCCKGIVGGIWKEYCGESVGKIEEVVCPRRGGRASSRSGEVLLEDRTTTQTCLKEGEQQNVSKESWEESGRSIVVKVWAKLRK